MKGSGLKDLITNEGLLTIEEDAFKGCNQLSHIYISSTVETITGIKSWPEKTIKCLDISPENHNFYHDGIILVDKKKGVLINR